MRPLACILFASLFLLACGGCNVIGVGAQIIGPPDIGAAYANMKGQTVAVIVWVDRGTKLDYPTLQADIAKSLTSKLKDLTEPKNKRYKPRAELVGVEYLNPMSVIRFQEDHPELEGLPPKDIATRLGVTRVIYIEVKDFQTHAPQAPDLFKGSVVTTLQVLEVSSGPNKVAITAYNNADFETSYPPDRPEGIPFGDISAQIIYDKSVDQFATEAAKLFFKHPEKG